MAAPQVATARLSAGMPRGVDLNLDRFNLSATVEMGSWAGTIEAPEGAEDLPLSGDVFWSSLKQGAASALSAEDKGLLSNVFHPQLSDRREEGDRFTPPPTSLTYMHKLKSLVKEEATVMQKRKEHFFSSEFVMDEAGPLFPSSWSSSIELAAQAGASFVKLVIAPAGFEDALNSAAPVFDKRTEDGTRFLVYRIGSLEARAIQEPDGKRMIGAVFSLGGSVQEASAAAAAVGANDDEELSKVTEYVEAAPTGALRCRFYVAFATEGGHAIVTEQLADGTLAWVEDPEGLEARNSLAKVMRTADCDGTVGELRRRCARCAQQVLLGGAPRAPSASERKSYAQAVFRFASTSQ